VNNILRPNCGYKKHYDKFSLPRTHHLALGSLPLSVACWRGQTPLSCDVPARALNVARRLLLLLYRRFANTKVRASGKNKATLRRIRSTLYGPSESDSLWINSARRNKKSSGVSHTSKAAGWKSQNPHAQSNKNNSFALSNGVSKLFEFSAENFRYQQKQFIWVILKKYSDKFFPGKFGNILTTFWQKRWWKYNVILLNLYELLKSSFNIIGIFELV